MQQSNYRYKVKLLAPLSPAPILDCNRRRNTRYRHTWRAVLHRVWTHVWNSRYNNVPCINVVMCVNAMWMCHHWFMHIETRPCLCKSRTRASTTVIVVIIHNTFHVHMVLQLFLTPPPKMGRSPRNNNFAILARIVWAWCPHAALMNPVMKGTTYFPICQKFEIFAANWCWWIGHLSPKCILVGSVIALSYIM